jgi:hypothetical protein
MQVPGHLTFLQIKKLLTVLAGYLQAFFRILDYGVEMLKKSKTKKRLLVFSKILLTSYTRSAGRISGGAGSLWT